MEAVGCPALVSVPSPGATHETSALPEPGTAAAAPWRMREGNAIKALKQSVCATVKKTMCIPVKICTPFTQRFTKNLNKLFTAQHASTVVQEEVSGNIPVSII